MFAGFFESIQSRRFKIQKGPENMSVSDDGE